MTRDNKELDRYNRKLEKNPHNFKALFGRAELFIDAGMLEKAFYDMREAAALDPNNKKVARALAGLGSYMKGIDRLYNEKDVNGALDYLLQASVTFPDNIGVMRRMSLCYMRLQAFNKAIEYLNKILEIDPEDYEAHNALASCYHYGYGVGKDHEKALELYKRAIDLMQNAEHKNWAVYTNMSDLLTAMKRYDEALSYAEKALSIEPNAAYALVARASALRALDRKREAMETLQKALVSEPDNAAARQLLQELTGMSTAEQAAKEGLTKFQLAEVPKTTFADVAGMDELKDALKELIIYPFTSPGITKEYGVKAGGGVLLYGPPGCGKTYIAKAIAGESKANLIVASIPEVRGVWVGTSERNIHNLFELARHSAPAILFIDEIDALGGTRGDASSGVYRQEVNVFLTELNGLSSYNENILVIGATNAPWLLDPALKRSGRFDQLIYIPPPDKRARIDLFRYYLRDKPLDAGIDFDRLGEITAYYSSAEIAAICDAASKIPWKEAIKTSKRRGINMQDIEYSISRVARSLPDWYEATKTAISNMRDLYPELARDIAEYERHRSSG